MEYFDSSTVKKHLPWSELVEALRQMFATGCEAPVRHHHPMDVPGREQATMLIMPAWLPGNYAGLKVVNVYPDNSERGLPTISGTYLLMDGATGAPVVAMDAGELTARRTVAASALAVDYLARRDASKLLIVGSGRLAGYAGFSHGAVRKLKEIRIWARDRAKAERVARAYRDSGLEAQVEDDLERGAGWADIITCVTLSTAPLILGKWLKAGVHVDLIGSFKPNMRETDDEAVARADVYADTREGVLAEAGDILQPMADGRFHADDIIAELRELVAGEIPGRTDEREITLFKSVGAALEDLAAAICCYANAAGHGS